MELKIFAWVCSTAHCSVTGHFESNYLSKWAEQMLAQFSYILWNLYIELFILVNSLLKTNIQIALTIILLIGLTALNLLRMQINDNSALIKEISSDLLWLNVPIGMFSTSFGVGKVPKICKLKFCGVL